MTQGRVLHMNSTDRPPLFKALGGSRLYGTDHSESDFDWFTVVDGSVRKPRHWVSEEGDFTEYTFSTLIKLAQEGSHQALDVMFTPSVYAEVDEIKYFRESWYCSPYAMLKLRDVARSHLLNPKSSPKRLRHGVRMALMVQEVYLYGRYNPRLEDEDWFYIQLTPEDPKEAALYASNLTDIDLELPYD